MVTVSAAAGAGVAGGVGVAASRHRHRAGAVEAVVGREGRRVDQRIGQSATGRLTVPPTAVMSAVVKSVGASLKVKVTVELLSPSLSEASTMSTVTVGFVACRW